MKPLSPPIVKYSFLAFFATHIPITICIDGQASLFGNFHPKFLQNVLTWYANSLSDGLFLDLQPWFSSLITCELFIQLPYFVVACHVILNGSGSSTKYEYPEWFRSLTLIYGSHTATTMIPILATTLLNEEFGTPESRRFLFGLYFPYLVFPLAIIYCASATPSSSTQQTKFTVMKGGTKWAFLIFFGTHIPITMLIDSQAAYSYHPQFAIDLVNWYSGFFKDPLMARPYHDKWFSAVVWGEVLLQVPFFCLALHQIQTIQKEDRYPQWFQTACILYGTHTATTLVPILTTLWHNPETTIGEKLLTIGIYLPYLVFPLWIVYLAAKPSLSRGKQD